MHLIQLTKGFGSSSGKEALSKLRLFLSLSLCEADLAGMLTDQLLHFCSEVLIKILIGFQLTQFFFPTSSASEVFNI